LQRNLEARRAQGKGFAADAEVGSGSGCCGTVSSKWSKGTGGPAGDECYNLIAQPVPYDLFQITAPVNRQNRAPGDPCHTLAKDNAAHAAVAFHPTQDPISNTDGSTHCMGTGSSRGDATIAVAVAPSLTATNDPSRSPQSSEVTQQVAAVHAASMTVRRLTPRECERLQGFPDDYTLIPWRKKQAEDCPDGPRYKALGNSMATNVVTWIGERIQAYETETKVRAAQTMDSRGNPSA
jgi:DNA (cytosine-5)-methyltransferase 1